MAGVAARLVVLFASLVALNGLSAYTQGLELTLDREINYMGTHDPCGYLTCKVKGNSVTIDTVTITKVKAAGGSEELIVVSTTSAEIYISHEDLRGNGTLQNNVGTIIIELVEPTLCVSGYFACEVIFTKLSGEREKSYTTAGPGAPPSLQAPLEPDHTIHTPGLDSFNQINEVKFESLDKRMTDLSSRVSRFEERAFLLPYRNPTTGPDATTDIEDLEKRVAALEAVRETDLVYEPQACERGMGDDVTKSYPKYAIFNDSTIQKQILCDTKTSGGGWVVIQRRTKGDVDFYRDWTFYRNGFGSVTGDFWLGNEAIHILTDRHPYELRIDFRLGEQEVYAHYDSFHLESESNKYRLRLGKYTGTIGEGSEQGLSYSNGMSFTTFDRDNDQSSINCAKEHTGAWWYKTCHNSNLNGNWNEKTFDGVSWFTEGTWLYPTYTEMKVRRVQINPIGK